VEKIAKNVQAATVGLDQLQETLRRGHAGGRELSIRNLEDGSMVVKGD